VEVKLFEASDRRRWDGFVDASKNGTFLHRRAYMEYHADRFHDHSLMVHDQAGELTALLPAHRREDVVESHGGLTFGGMLCTMAMTAPLMRGVFDRVLAYLRQGGCRSLVYRSAPHIYHRAPAEEDLWVLALHGARLVKRSPLAVLAAGRPVPRQQRRRRGERRAAAAGLVAAESPDLAAYWQLLTAVLRETYDAAPIHDLGEISRLQLAFPEQIRLFACSRGEQMVAGVLVYESERVARAQYIAASTEGRELAALDLVFAHLLDDVYRDKPFIDLGTSEGIGWRDLNAGVLEFKESLGARVIVQDTYELALD
jgi:hypothetical protein